LVQRELRAAAEAFWSRERFVRIRLLERLGLIALEPDDTYVLAMISAIGPNKADTLRADPELVKMRSGGCSRSKVGARCAT
jgi:hypothetical protein